MPHPCVCVARADVREISGAAIELTVLAAKNNNAISVTDFTYTEQGPIEIGQDMTLGRRGRQVIETY
jgi:hypothetical protein